MTNNGCEELIGTFFKVAFAIFVVLVIVALFGDFWWVLLLIIAVVVIAIFVSAKNDEKRNAVLQEEMSIQELKAEEVEAENREKYKEYIDTVYFHSKLDPNVNTILNNFISEIPNSIFLFVSCFSYLESLIISENMIGKKLLWSNNLRNDSPLDYGPKKQVSDFYSGQFAQLKRLLQSIITLENGYDYSFLILRFIQDRASSFEQSQLRLMTGIEFDNVEKLPLEDCLYSYYDKYQKYGRIYEDPLLCAFTHFLIANQKFGIPHSIDDNNFIAKRLRVLEMLVSNKNDFDFRIFEAKMKKPPINSETKYTIMDIDLMSGFEFEDFIAQVFERMGYHTEVTKHTGDYGVDVIAEQDGVKIAIQAKCYANSVSNSAVQEIAAGMKHYHCQRGIVVTNRYFTKPAIELANSNGVQLWDRITLQEKIEELF